MLRAQATDTICAAAQEPGSQGPTAPSIQKYHTKKYINTVITSKALECSNTCCTLSKLLCRKCYHTSLWWAPLIWHYHTLLMLENCLGLRYAVGQLKSVTVLVFFYCGSRLWCDCNRGTPSCGCVVDSRGKLTYYKCYEMSLQRSGLKCSLV